MCAAEPDGREVGDVRVERPLRVRSEEPADSCNRELNICNVYRT